MLSLSSTLAQLLVAAAATGTAATPDGGLATGRGQDAGFDAARSSTWRLSAKLGKGSPLREALVADLTADAGLGVGEVPLAPAEAEALLDDPRAQLVYGDKTVDIVAPSMLVRQRSGHLDLLKIFLEPERLDAGAKFARAHAPVLDRVETRTGVDREVIVSILMWETRLGTITGDFHAFNAFTSQAFFVDEASGVALSRKAEKALYDPEVQARRIETIRSRARRNLLALVRQCKARGIDTLEVKGSWAGALGYPQFMPASLRWAEDGDGDGRIDLFSFDDSIASVGRYLSENGFKANREQGVWEYNHEAAYVQGVLAYADALKKRLAVPADAGAPARAAKKKSGPVQPAEQVRQVVGRPGDAKPK